MHLQHSPATSAPPAVTTTSIVELLVTQVILTSLMDWDPQCCIASAEERKLTSQEELLEEGYAVAVVAFDFGTRNFWCVRLRIRSKTSEVGRRLSEPCLHLSISPEFRLRVRGAVPASQPRTPMGTVGFQGAALDPDHQSC